MLDQLFVFINLQNLFSYVNLALGCAILLYLRHFISYQKIAQRSGISTFVPILTHQQSYLFVTGFTLWTITLLLDTIRGSDFLVLPGAIRNNAAFFIELIEPLLQTAATMYIGHALMVFAAHPVKEGKSPPNLNVINGLRQGGLLTILVIGMVPASIGANVFEQSLPWLLYHGLLIGMQWVVMLHVFIQLRHSMHPLKTTIVLVLALWAVNAPMQIAWFPWIWLGQPATGALLDLEYPAGAWVAAGMSTITLLVFLSMLLRANFLYVQETFRRASTFKKEKEVMVTYLRRISEKTNVSDTQPALDPAQSILEQQDLDRLLRLTLEFGKEVSGARAAALFVRDDLRSMLLEPRSDDRRGRFLSATTILGPYPPQFEVSNPPQDTHALELICHQMLRSEKIQVGESVIGKIAQQGTSLLIPDAHEEEWIVQQQIPSLQIHSWLAIPMAVQNQTVAVLSFINKNQGRSPFTFEDEATLSALAEQASIALANMVIHTTLREKERLEREIELASEVQRLLLPSQNPVIPGYDVAAMSTPAQDVGGDYYDVLWLDKDRVMLVVADVSDKGIPGALNMASLRSALRTFTSQEKGGRELLIELNHFVQPDMRRGMFVSLILVILHLPTGHIEVARAGHEPLILQRKDRDDFEMLAPDGMALGVIDGDFFSSQIRTQTTHLGPEDRIILYTDGITEMMNPRREEFSLERLLNALRETHQDSAHESLQNIQQRVNSFSMGTPQHDDLTLMILQRNAALLEKRKPA